MSGEGLEPLPEGSKAQEEERVPVVGRRADLYAAES